MGGEPLTFSGLAGMGDLVATCISPQSRNRHVGEQLGKGRTIDEIIAEMNMVAEGVKTSQRGDGAGRGARRRDADRCGGRRRRARGPQRRGGLPRPAPAPGDAGTPRRCAGAGETLPPGWVHPTGSPPVATTERCRWERSKPACSRRSTAAASSCPPPAVGRSTGGSAPRTVGTFRRGNRCRGSPERVDGAPVVETSMRVPGGEVVHRAYGAAVLPTPWSSRSRTARTCRSRSRSRSGPTTPNGWRRCGASASTALASRSTERS